MLGLPLGLDGLAELSPQGLKTHTMDTLVQMCLNGSRQRPQVLEVEDLHWIDATSEEGLALLVARLAGAPILLVTTYRPGYRPAWLDKSYATQLALARLTPQDSRRVLQAVWHAGPTAERLTQEIVAKAEGNPFFLEELAWMVWEQGEHAQHLPMPDTIQAVLAARLDRLPPEEKRLVQTTAVISTEVPFPLLHAIAEMPEAVLHRGLAHLQAAEFLYETHLFPEHVYTFKHALTHEVVYGGLLQERRRLLHARIVDALEALAGDRVPEQVERLAHHALRGEVWDKALTHFRQAGEKALARSAHREAVWYFEQALSALAHLPEQRATREQAIDLRLALRTALLPFGDLGRVLGYLREAEALATALDDYRRLGQATHFLSRHFYLRGAYDQAVASAQHTLALATANGDVALHALANFHLGIAYQAQGDYRRAMDCFNRTVACLDGAQRYERFGQVIFPVVHSCANLASCHAELGTFPEGSALGEEGLRIAEVVEHPARRPSRCTSLWT